MTENKNSEVKDFYDSFNLNRKGVYRNLRHYKIINTLFKEGLKKHHSLLEVGCGAGPISIVIASFLKKGHFLGMDISPKSIKFLNALFKDKQNVNFVASDIGDFNTDKKFDFILMADVLEHIPIEIHEQTFSKLAENCREGGKLIINIPTAEFIKWQEIHEPDIIQIIDQALPTSHVVSLANKYGFVCLYTKKHILFQKSSDFELFVFEKTNGTTDFNKRKKSLIILDKTKNRIKAFFNVYIFNY